MSVAINTQLMCTHCKSVIAAVIGALLLTIAPPASSLNVSVGDVVVEQLSEYGFVSTNSVLSFDGNGTDQLYQMYAFIGTATGTIAVNAANFRITTAISESGGVATSSLSLNGSTALGLAADAITIDYTFTLIDDTSAADDDGFLWDITLTNDSGADLNDLDFYTYLDLDLGGATDFADDAADGDNRFIHIWDTTPGSTDEFYWVASNGGAADDFAILPFPQLQNFLADSNPLGDLPNGSSLFDDDFTGAFQYTMNLADGEVASIGMGSIGAIPEPSTTVLLLLGLAGLAFTAERHAPHR